MASAKPSSSKTPPIDFRGLSPRNQGHKTALVTVANGAMFLVLDLPLPKVLAARSVLYMHVHRATGRCYIGITIMPAGGRWVVGHGYRNQHVGHAVKRYGWAAFDPYLLAFFDDREEANLAEKAAITAAGGHKSKHTFNSSPGGDFVADNDIPVVGVNLKTGETRRFKSGLEAAQALGLPYIDAASRVARGDIKATRDWWFRFEDDVAAKPPAIWGEELRHERIRQVFGKALEGFRLGSSERRTFRTTAEAAEALGLQQTAVSQVARGKIKSARGWWFRFEGDRREPPLLYGSALIRSKLDRTVYGTHLGSGEQRVFRNCTVADRETGLHAGAASSVLKGSRASAGGWWFSHTQSAKPPPEYGVALVARARSKPLEAILVATGERLGFRSAKSASLELGVHRSTICLALTSGKVVKGWRFNLVSNAGARRTTKKPAPP